MNQLRYFLIALFLAPVFFCEEELLVQIRRISIAEHPDIEVLFTVKDPLGRALENLERSQLRFTENRQPLENYFMEVTNEPVKIMLVVDDSGSMHNYRLKAARAVRAFVRRLKIDDQAGLIAFSETVRVLSPITPNKDALIESLKGLRGFGPTSLYDAIYKAAEMLPGGGKTAMVVLSDGVDQNKENTDRLSNKSSLDAVTLAAKKRIPIYTIGLGRSILREELMDFARLTEGSFYFAPSTEQLEDIYQQVARNIKSDVRIRYTTPNLGKDASMRLVELRVVSENRMGTAKADWLAPGVYSLETSGFGYDVDQGTSSRDLSLKFTVRDDSGMERTGGKEFLHSFVNQLGK